MMESTKKKVMVVEIVLLLVIPSIAVFIYLDNFDNNLLETAPEETDEQNEELDSTAERVANMVSQLDESMIIDYISKLSSFGPHVTARRIPYKISQLPIIGKIITLPIEKVANYIYKEFESMGLMVRYQYWEQEPTIKNLKVPKWFTGWFVGNNIEATLPGKNESSDEIYLMIAHHDTMPFCTGANDDSSGVAAILATAKVMSQYSFDHTVRFVTVDGEEQGLLGSHFYVEEALKNNDNIVATICIDMIGTHGPSYRETEVLYGASKESSWLSHLVVSVNKRYPEHFNYTLFYDDPENHFSDHREFLDDGYNAIYFSEATEDPDWHKSSDVLKNMDVPYASKVSKLLLATFAELACNGKNGC
jgi:hypothetical protein